MRLADIIDNRSGYDRIRYPAIAHVVVAEGRIDEFEKAAKGHPQIAVIDWEIVEDVVVLRIGCISNAVRLKLLALMDGDSQANF